MIIGNQQAKNQLKTYLQQHTWEATGQASFFLLHGPINIGKSAIALELASEYLGDYIHWWLLHIRDFSSILGKKHTIKVEETNSTEDYKLLWNDYQYQDRGVREINNRLQQSSFWWSKVVLIENIERMTKEATNAFLKSCEEPLAKRIIIATTSNKAKILDTILSRAIVIPFFPLSDQEMQEYMKIHNITIESEELQDLLLMMAMGKPWTLDIFYKKLEEDSDLKQKLLSIIHLLPQPGKIGEKYKILEYFQQQGMFEQFLDAWIAYTVRHNLPNTENRLKIKKLLQANIQKENVILYGILN